MIRTTVAILVCLTVLLSASMTSVAADPPVAPGEIIVKFKAGTPASEKSLLHRQNGSKVLHEERSLGICKVTSPKGSELSHALKYKKSRWVEYAEPNYIASISDVVPSDPYFVNQWDLQKIATPAAWDITVGSESVIIAVVDTGVDYNHPDLSGRMIAGYDFVNGDADPMDDNGHGTCVAGIVAASPENGIGVAGITWWPSVMPIKVASASGYASYYAIAQGITYAANNGARVVNISIAGSSSSSTLTNAVDYATQRGCLVVAASGNNSSATVYYPAACSNALAVGATDAYDQRASYSNYGPALDVMAPGGGYTTTRGGGYGGFGGTSAATPHAAGVAALVISVNPNLSAADVAAIIAQSADDIGDAGWDQYTGWGRVNAYKAVLMAASYSPSVRAAGDTSAPTVTLTSPANGATVTGAVTLTASASDNVGVTTIDFYVDGTRVAGGSSTTAFWDSRSVSNGSHAIYAKAYDAAGNASTSPTVTVNVDNPVTYTQVFSGTASTKNVKSHTWTAVSPVTVKASLSWSGTGTLELRLYNSQGSLLGQASGSSAFSLSPGVLQAGTYRFEIRALSGKPRYSLTVTASSP